MYFLSLILVLLGGIKPFGVLIQGLGVYLFVVICLLRGSSSVLPNFQGLEVGSYSHHRVVGGDQSLDTCNSRKKDCGEGGLYLVNSFSGVKLIG